MKKIYLIMILFFAIASGVFAQTANIVTLTLKAKSGEAEAQNALGEAYYDGKGVTENLTEAVKWFTKAAEQENAKAEYNLGNCYYYGNGVQYRDRGEAVNGIQKRQSKDILKHKTTKDTVMNLAKELKRTIKKP